MPTTQNVLNLSKQIDSRDPKLIDNAFVKLLIEIKNKPLTKVLGLKANHLESRHFPLLLEALKAHKSLISVDLSYNFLQESNPNLAPLMSLLVNNNPNLEEINLRACRIDDIEFDKIIKTLSLNSLSKIFIDFSQNKVTSISADLAIRNNVNLSTLERLGFNNQLKKGNDNIYDIIREIIEGDDEKKSPVLTAYLNSQNGKNCSAEENDIISGIKAFRLVK